ncbi:hypothetical protein N9980_01230 [bacterium]|nr:hypothetical protein [bacterium]
MKRLLITAFILLPIPVMAQDESRLSHLKFKSYATEGMEADETLLEVLGVCGGIHRSILDLGPKKLDGQLDTDPVWVGESVTGEERVMIPSPAVVRKFFPNHHPDLIEFREFKGTVQAATIIWRGTQDEKSGIRIREGVLSYLTRSNGPPSPSNEGQGEWTDDLTRTVVSWSKPEDDLYLGVFFSCLAKEDEYFEALESAETPDGKSVAVAKNTQERTAPDRWFWQSIASMLVNRGQPSEEPYEIGERIVGLHYGGLDIQDWPYEEWYWFFEGSAVYSAAKFLPMGESSNAVESFETFRKTALDDYGEPNENILGEDGNPQRLIWRKGPHALSLTFVEGGGDPWFLFEAYDTTLLDKIDIDLRPSSTLPERYEPPPPDSGKERSDLAPEVAAG